MYYIIYKPFNVLSQFSPQAGKQTLKDHFDIPSDAYPVGRLDYDSEGLLIITSDKTLNAKLLDPKSGYEKEYWVQVEGEITEEALNLIRNGVEINVDGKVYLTKKCRVKKFTADPVVPLRNPPIRFRQNIPTSWISIIITEGKNRQVRKMTAKAGFPTLRLIRWRISNINIEGLQPGEMRILNKAEIHNLLFS